MGWSDEELAGLLVEELDPEELGDADEVPEPPAEPVTRPGDVWLLGRHRLMCGDSTDTMAMERLMENKPADLWLTDPPYNVAYEGKTAEALTIKNDSMTNSDFRQFLHDVYVAANCFLKPGASFYIWHADSEGYNFRGAAHDVGWKVRQCLVWVKSVMVMGRQDYQWKHEPCLYGWTDGAAHFWASDRKQTTVLEFDKPRRNGEHPTMKPVELFEYLMSNSTKLGAVALDSFGGSGTTVIAAERLGRMARLMELDPRYCDVIVKRWQQFTGKTATLESTGEPFPVAE
jgi:site-specific DNA-methyltransferase (adenine-specific)